MEILLKEVGKLLIKINDDIERKDNMRDLTSHEREFQSEIRILMNKMKQYGIDHKHPS